MWSTRGLMVVVEGLCRGRLGRRMQGTMLSEEPSHRANKRLMVNLPPMLTAEASGHRVRNFV